MLATHVYIGNINRKNSNAVPASNPRDKTSFEIFIGIGQHLTMWKQPDQSK